MKNQHRHVWENSPGESSGSSFVFLRCFLLVFAFLQKRWCAKLRFLLLLRFVTTTTTRFTATCAGRWSLCREKNQSSLVSRTSGCCFSLDSRRRRWKWAVLSLSFDMPARGAPRSITIAKRRRSWTAITSNWIKPRLLFVERRKKETCARSKDRSSQERSDAYAYMKVYWPNSELLPLTMM